LRQLQFVEQIIGSVQLQKSSVQNKGRRDNFNGIPHAPLYNAQPFFPQ
jgi:hypothetical protein